MNLIEFEIGERQGGLSVLKELKMGSNSLELYSIVVSLKLRY